MTLTATKAIEGTYEADQIHSVFGFSVVHNGISTYRGSLDDVSATLHADGDGLELEGAAKVESISIHEPEEFRARAWRGVLQRDRASRVSFAPARSS